MRYKAPNIDLRSETGKIIDSGSTTFGIASLTVNAVHVLPHLCRRSEGLFTNCSMTIRRRKRGAPCIRR